MLRAAALVALVLAGTATAAPPREGVLVPGRSLGGIALGDTAAEVKATWGTRFGRCRNCPQTTWYFTFRPFTPEGAGVELRRGRVAAVFTLWQPNAWHTREGLYLSEPVVRVTEVYGALTRRECGTYYALTMPGRNAVTAFYVSGEELWAFGLLRPGVPVCR